MYQSKAAVKSAGIMGPLIAMIVIASGMIGVDISEDVAGLPEKIADVVDGVVTIGGIAVGIWGRWRATKEISGVFKAKT